MVRYAYIMQVPQLQPQPTFPLPLPVAPSYGPQWGNFGDTAARFNNTASVQHNTLAHTPVASHPISSAQHALSQVPSQQSLVDSERASRAMQILELQKQVSRSGVVWCCLVLLVCLVCSKEVRNVGI